MAQFELPTLPERPMNAELLLGAASPLWGYYGAAAAGGVAYWWMTRWTQPMNLEALFGRATASPAPEAAPTAEAPQPELPSVVGGEEAPVSPLAAAGEQVVEAIVAAADPEPEPELPILPEAVTAAPEVLGKS